MDSNLLLIEIEKNLKNCNLINENESMIRVAIYEKTLQEIKDKKLKELREYLTNQVKFYQQNELDYKQQISLDLKEYEEKINQLIKVYNNLYLSTFKNMEKAISNQIIAVGNIVTLWNKRKDKVGKEFEKANKQLMAVVQKKVNYSVIIEECKSRLDWCMENSKNDLNNIFVNNFYEIDIYRGGFFAKISRKLSNMINGKKKLTQVLNKYKNENLKQITDNSNSKMNEIFALTNGVLDQIKNVEEQINMQYEQAMQSV